MKKAMKCELNKKKKTKRNVYGKNSAKNRIFEERKKKYTYKEKKLRGGKNFDAGIYIRIYNKRMK